MSKYFIFLLIILFHLYILSKRIHSNVIEHIIITSFHYTFPSEIFSIYPGRQIRLSDPVGSYRENIGILSDPMGIRRKLSESLAPDSDRKLSDVGKCRNDQSSDRNRGYSDTFRHPTTSDRNPIPRILSEFVRSDRILWGSFDLG
jgi:hypothetical protein